MHRPPADLWPPMRRIAGGLVPAELSPEALFDLLSSRALPVASIIERLLSVTGADYVVVFEDDGLTSSGTPTHAPRLAIGMARDGRSIAFPHRLLPDELRRRLRAGDAPLHDGLDSTASIWRVAAPILSLHSSSSSSVRRLVGGLLAGGHRGALRPPFRKCPGDLVRLLVALAPWVGTALLVENGRPGDGDASDADHAPGRDGPTSPATPILHPELEDPLDPDFPDILTVNPAMRRLFELIRQVAASDAAVLVEGESGTGKELVARAIHEKSPRRSAPFLSENCAACPADLLEAEFFGYEKGAFTGATSSRAGIFERARGGTLFLDEIGEMDARLQTKLLRVLQEREVRRVGGERALPVDFRLVTATNRSLEEEVRSRRFRLDLLYRLEVVKISLPPLRERVEDIPHLARHFLAVHAARLGRAAPELRPNTVQVLSRYHWPGNIRELQNEMWRAVALGHCVVRPRHLSAKLRRIESGIDVDVGPVDFDEAERQLLGSVMRAALIHTDGNCAEAARLLGIPRSSFYRRLRKYRISPTSPDGIPPAVLHGFRRLGCLAGLFGKMTGRK